MSQKLYPFGTVNYTGYNSADNKVDTSLVVAKEDGSLLERSEWIIGVLGSGGGRLRIQQSLSTVAEDKAVIMFSVSLYDFNTGAILAADIDITGITQTMKRSRGGGAFSDVTAPVFAKDDGRVYCAYEFVDVDWQVGDIYKLTLSGIEVDIGGATVYVPAMIWSNMVQEQVDLHAKVDAIQEDIGDPSTRTNLQSLEAMLGNPDVASKTLYETQAVPVEDSANDIQVRDVVGKKSDTVAGTSIVALTKINKTAIDDVQADIGNPSSRTFNLKSIEAMLGNPDADDMTLYKTQEVPVEDTATDTLARDVIGKKSDTVAGTSLVALTKINKVTIDDVQANVGDPSARTTNLKSLLALLGNPDTDDKSIYEAIKNIRETAVDGSSLPVANTLSDILHKDGSYTFDNTTDSLEAISDLISSRTTGAGSLQVATTTEDLNQAVGTYDLFTGTSQAVLLERFVLALPDVDVSDDAAITSITVQTDHTTPQVIFNATTGATANLTAQAQLSWEGCIYIPVGTKIQLTIAGGASDAETVCPIAAQYRAVVAGGTLA